MQWKYFTRLLGVAALIYEVVVEKADKPALMVVVGSMVVGTEAIQRIMGGKHE